MASCDSIIREKAPSSAFCSPRASRFLTKTMSSDADENEPLNFISHLRTIVILAARRSSSSDIDIAAIDKIVETTVDFVKNTLEQMANDQRASSSFSAFDLLNTMRVRCSMNLHRTASSLL